MPLDSVETGAPVDGLQPVSPRRHSLPQAVDVRSIEVGLHHQLSLMEKRRSIQELRRQNNELLANLKLNKRRRLFAKAGRAATTEPEGPKVTFLDVDEVTEDLKGILRNHRRGSAPSTLLLNQINKIAHTASKAAMHAGHTMAPPNPGSRDASPRSCLTCRRRSSLPTTDSLEPPVDKSRSLSREKAIKKRKLLRRRSAGSGDDYAVTGKRRNPLLGCRHWGSLKSSSFGGVGSAACPPPTVNLVPPKIWKNKNCLQHHWEDRFHGGQLYTNGRRGSLPLELILC